MPVACAKTTTAADEEAGVAPCGGREGTEPALWDVLVNALPEPALALDDAGVLLGGNAPARALLPELAPGVAVQRVLPGWPPPAAPPAPAPSGVPLPRGRVATAGYEAALAAVGEGFALWRLTPHGSTDTPREAHADLTPPGGGGAGPSPRSGAVAGLRPGPFAPRAVSARRPAAPPRPTPTTAAPARDTCPHPGVLLSAASGAECLRRAAAHPVPGLADSAAVVVGAAHPHGRGAVAHASGDGPARLERDLPLVGLDEVPGLAAALAPDAGVAETGQVTVWPDGARLPDWLTRGRPVGSVLLAPLTSPLRYRTGPLGALILLRAPGRPAFGPEDAVRAAGYAGEAGAALAGWRLSTELDTLAATLRPVRGGAVRVHRYGTLEAAGSCRPAPTSPGIGGDFLDVHPTGQGCTLVVGDVCGAGTGAAVRAARSHSAVAALCHAGVPTEAVPGLLNDLLCRDDDDQFVTLALAALTPRADGAGTLKLVSAGHPAPLVLRRDGSVHASSAYGTLLGVLPEVSLSAQRTVLRPGESCLLYTDGVTEARRATDDRQFGERRLRKALAGCVGLPVEAVVERIGLLLADWLGTAPRDDVTLAAVRVAPTAR